MNSAEDCNQIIYINQILEQFSYESLMIREHKGPLNAIDSVDEQENKPEENHIYPAFALIWTRLPKREFL